MIRMRLLICLLLCLYSAALWAQLEPCDPPIAASISVSGPVCAGGTVFITFNLPFDDDDDESYDVTYNIGGAAFTLLEIVDGHTVGHIITASGSATLMVVVENDDDDGDDACFTTINQTIPVAVSNPALNITGQINPGCGQNNGSITASAFGGVSPYQYSLNGGPFQNSAVFSNLGAGDYNIVARDATGCTSTATTVTLAAAAAPNVSITNQANPGCGQNNGSITASAFGGVSPYQYSLNGGPFQNSAMFSNLGAGNYNVVARDAAGCTSTATTVTLTAAAAPNVNIANQINPGCGQNNGSITASASGGVSPYQYSLNGGPFQNSALFSSLSAGNYNVVARDAAGCSSLAATTTLTSPSPVNAAIQANTTQGCSNTVFTLTGNLPPGTTGLWSSNAVQPPTPAHPVWTLSNLPPGNLSLTWTLSAPGCPNYNAASVVLQVSAPPQANTDGVFQVEQGDDAAVEVLLNDLANSPFQLRILKNPSEGDAFFNNQNILEYQPGAAASGNDTVVYELCYLACPEVCDTALVLFRNLRNDDPCVLRGDTSNVFTNGLTPNGDGRNDLLVFRVVSVEDCAINYAKSDIIIYNRWGDVVFEASPYNNDWGGTNRNGNNLPPGVYYFVLRVTLDEVYTQFGSVILIR